METAEALDRLASYLLKQGLKSTSQRRLITEVFFDAEFEATHPTVEELYMRARERDPRVGHATVYRTLKLLVECGLAEERRLGGNQTRYEPEHPGEHHDHLVCTECGAILEFEEDRIEDLQEEVAQRMGFALDDHRMVLYGAPGSECNAPGCQRE